MAELSVDRQARALAKASYERCAAAPDFFEAFYRNFLAACPQVTPLFAHTDFERLHRLLRHALGLLLAFPGRHASDPNLLARIAERHSRRDLNIDPALYRLFIDSLVDTVKHYDPEYTPAIEAAWRSTVAKGVAYMQSKY